MVKRTVVVLEIRDDDESREWWQALGLPEPSRWNIEDEPFPREDVYVSVRLEERLS